MTVAQKIPKGYKQTEVGAIPEDWEVKKLRDIVSHVIDNRGKTPPYSEDGDIELIETASISFVNRYPDYSKVTKFVSKKVCDYWFRGHPIEGDVLISTVGEYSGSSAIMGESRGTIAQNLIAIRIKMVNSAYVFYWTRSDVFKKQLEQVMMNQAQPSLRVPWLLNFNLSVPKTEAEQKTIVSSLSDIDDLISSLEKLLAKKRMIKQGTMQELLTGKRRLPGFSRKWEYRELNKLCHSINDGTHRTPKYVDEGIPFYSVENVIANNFKDTKFITQEEHEELIKRCKPEKGDILLTRIGDIGAVRLIDWDVVASIYVSLALLKVNKVNDEIDKYYLYWYMKSFNFINALKKAALMNAIPPKINMGDIGKVTIFFPIDREEQIAIAKVLGDMDTEIDTLELQLAKYRHLKQGMMQVLLTGKIRLN